MTKGQRIPLFIFGFLLGCVLVYFVLFKGRDRSYWLPGNRVKELIMKSELIYSPHAQCIMACRKINKEEVMIVLTNGDVNFEESNVRNTPCPSYAIDGTLPGNKKIRIIVTTVDSIAEIETAIDLAAKKDSCICK